MSAYYLAIAVIDLVILLFTALLSFNNSIMNKRQRAGFAAVSALSGFIVIIEWLVYFLDGNIAVPLGMQYFVNGALFVPAIFVPILMGMALSTDKLYKYMMIGAGVVDVVMVIAIFTHKLFYFDADYSYHRGPLYWLYIAAIFVGIVYLLYEMFCMITMFQNKNKAALVILILFLLAALIFNILFTNIHMTWTCVSLVILMLYGYYNEFWEQIDILTGLLSQSSFIRQTEKIKGELSVIIFDVDDFKQVNDDFGHAAGDRVLAEVAGCILNVYKKYGMAFRTGGDEFCVVYRGPEDLQKNLGTELCRQLEEKREKIPYLPYVSFGSAKFENGKDVKKSLLEADASMYLYKARRKNNNVAEGLTLPGLDELAGEYSLEELSEMALENREFEVWYQPKYSAQSLLLAGAEALVRWRHDGKLIPPGAFIAAFERTGFIQKLDEYVFEAVCAKQKEWETLGMGPVPISVNLSRISVCQNGIAERYRQIVNAAGISPDIVPIEITETAAVNSMLVRNNADDLIREGFQLHMDDFGTGYSSLASLNTLDFSVVKIDKSIIDYIGNPGTENLIRHIISFAQESGMQVVAEGVENISQVDFLQTANCDQLQGFYFSKPVECEEFEQLLRESDQVFVKTDTAEGFEILEKRDLMDIISSRAFNEKMAGSILGAVAIYIVKDNKAELIAANDPFFKLFDKDFDYLKNRQARNVSALVVSDDRNRFDAMFDRAMSGSSEIVTERIRFADQKDSWDTYVSCFFLYRSSSGSEFFVTIKPAE